MAEKTFPFAFPFDVDILTNVALTQDDVQSWVDKERPTLEKYEKDETLSMGIAAYWETQQDRNAHTLAVALRRYVLIIDLDKVPVLPPEMKSWFSKAKVYCFDVKETKNKLRFLEISFKRWIEVVGSLKTVMEDGATMIGEHNYKKPRAIVKSKTEVMTEAAARFATSEAYGCFANGTAETPKPKV